MFVLFVRPSWMRSSSQTDSPRMLPSNDRCFTRSNTFFFGVSLPLAEIILTRMRNERSASSKRIPFSLSLYPTYTVQIAFLIINLSLAFPFFPPPPAIKVNNIYIYTHIYICASRLRSLAILWLWFRSLCVSSREGFPMKEEESRVYKIPTSSPRYF